MFVLLPAPEETLQPHLHFHTFSPSGTKKKCRSSVQEIYTLLFGNSRQTAAAAAEPRLLAGDIFYAFPSQRQM